MSFRIMTERTSCPCREELGKGFSKVLAIMDDDHHQNISDRPVPPTKSGKGLETEYAINDGLAKVGGKVRSAARTARALRLQEGNPAYTITISTSSSPFLLYTFADGGKICTRYSFMPSSSPVDATTQTFHTSAILCSSPPMPVQLGRNVQFVKMCSRGIEHEWENHR